MRDHQSGAESLGLLAIAFDMRRRPFVGFDRPGELLFDAGAKYLDRDLAALGGDGAVDLGDRGGADRHLVELGEETFQGRVERVLDRLLDLGERGGGQIVLQLRQVFGGLGPDQIGAGR